MHALSMVVPGSGAVRAPPCLTPKLRCTA